jgi:hypothetical protein
VLLHTVTITGADDATDIDELVGLSDEFPFLELGILVSKSQEGAPRFPSRSWIDRLGEVAIHKQRRLRVAMHLCDRWMRELLTGDLVWEDLPSVSNFADTIQFNTNGLSVEPNPRRFFDQLRGSRKLMRNFIFQWNSVGEPLARLAYDRHLYVMGLFDGSGGLGFRNIPFPMGFAGGLGPDNVLEQLDKILAAYGDRQSHTWIDVEDRVRTDDGVKLDMSRVRSVLEQVAASRFLAHRVLMLEPNLHG